MSSIVSPHLFPKNKMTFLIKLDENYYCVLKLMSSTKISLSEFIENMCYFYFQMQACTYVIMCDSNKNYFGQCFPIKFPTEATFTLYVYVL